MQTSGMAPQFSDGARKTIRVAPAKPAPAKAPAKPANTHQAGGFAKHKGKC
jgi:hypothetical protein